jgi:hypothetical protein
MFEILCDDPLSADLALDLEDQALAVERRHAVASLRGPRAPATA